MCGWIEIGGLADALDEAAHIPFDDLNAERSYRDTPA
jgi:hypothetical protein